MLYLKMNEILSNKWQIYLLSKLAMFPGFHIISVHNQTVLLSQVNCSFSTASIMQFAPRKLCLQVFISSARWLYQNSFVSLNHTEMNFFKCSCRNISMYMFLCVSALLNSWTCFNHIYICFAGWKQRKADDFRYCDRSWKDRETEQTI